MAGRAKSNEDAQKIFNKQELNEDNIQNRESEDPYWNSIKHRYNVKGMSDKELADALASEDILRSNISDEDLYKSNMARIRSRAWAIPQGREFTERKNAEQNPKTAHIRKLYYLSLKRLLNEVQQNADRAGRSPAYQHMQGIVDKGMAETFPEGYAEPIAPEYMGEYGMHLEPGDTQDFLDAYSGGGYPGPSFVPNKYGNYGQTAPIFETPKKPRKKKARGGRIKKKYARGGGIRKPKGF